MELYIISIGAASGEVAWLLIQDLQLRKARERVSSEGGRRGVNFYWRHHVDVSNSFIRIVSLRTLYICIQPSTELYRIVLDYTHA